MCHHLPVFSKQSTLSYMMQEEFMATSGEGEAIDLAAKGTTLRNCCGTPKVFEGVSTFLLDFHRYRANRLRKSHGFKFLGNQEDLLEEILRKMQHP